MGLKNKVQALIGYANETTGKGDTLLGDAVKTLCDGYGGHEAEVEGTFMQRTTADGLSIKDGCKAKAVSVKGNTWVRNQLIRNGNFAEDTTGWFGNAGIAQREVSEGVLTLRSTSQSGYYYQILDAKLNHKYLFICDCFSTDAVKGINVADFTYVVTPFTLSAVKCAALNRWETLSLVFTPRNEGNYYLELRCEDTATKFRRAISFDLTQWFGSGNEPATALEFAQRLGYSSVDEIPYMEYNTGEIVGVNHLCLPPARKVEVEQYVGALRTSLSVLPPIIEGNTIILEGQSTGAGQYRIHENAVDVVKGHKYLILCNGEHDTIEGSDMQLRTSNSSPCPKLARGVLSAIFEATASATNSYIMVTLFNQQYSIRLTPQLYDLTAIFGEGNEPTSVEDFYRLCPWAKDYQPYGTQDRIIGFGVEERTPFVGKVNWNQLHSATKYNLNGNPPLFEVVSSSSSSFKLRASTNITTTTRGCYWWNAGSGYLSHKCLIHATINSTCASRWMMGNDRERGYHDIPIGISEFNYIADPAKSAIGVLDNNWDFYNARAGEIFEGDEIEFYNIMVFDLTQMFGEGNEPITAEEFYRRCPFARDYQPYNAGEERMIGQSSLLPINTANFPYGMHGFMAYDKKTYTQDIHTPKEDIKNVGLVILDGTERGWTVYSYREHCWQISTSRITDTNILRENMCRAIGWESLSSSALGTEDGVYVSVSSYFIVSVLDCTTLDEFKAKIAKNPIVFMFKLATPIVTPCDDSMAFEAYDQGTEEVVGSDAPITMAARYKDGASLPNPVVIPPASLPLAHEIGSLLSYANEVTGAGDTRMGDAIKTLCDGYEIKPICSLKKSFAGTTSEAIVTSYQLWGDDMKQWTLAAYCPDNKTTTRGTALHCMYEASPWYGLVRQSGNGTTRGVNWNVNGNVNREWDKVTLGWVAKSNDAFREGMEKPFAISRDNDHLYYTTDGHTWLELQISVPMIDSVLVLGAKRNTNGSLIQPYDSNGEVMLLELYDRPRCNVSSFFEV